MFGFFEKKNLPENPFASSVILSRCVVARMLGKDFDKVALGVKYHFVGAGEMNHISVRVSEAGLAQVGIEGIYSIPHDDTRLFGTVIVLGCEFLAKEQVAEPNPFDRDELRNAMLLWGSKGCVESCGMKQKLALERRLLIDDRRYEAFAFSTARLHEIVDGDLPSDQKVQGLADMIRALATDVDKAAKQCGMRRS